MTEPDISFDDLPNVGQTQPTVAAAPPVVPVEERALPPVQGVNSRGTSVAPEDITFGDLPQREPNPTGVEVVTRPVTGFLANLNRGLGVGDEFAAGVNTARDIVTGNSGPDVVQTYKDEMGRQRATEAAFAGPHPHVAALARGTGNALLMAAPAGPGAEAYLGGSIVGNALRGATTAGLGSAAYSAVDAGTPAERLKAASDASLDPLTLALGAGAGSLASLRPRGVRPDAPSLESLEAQKNAAYQAVDQSGIRYTPEAFGGLTQDMAKALDDSGFNAGLHPKTAAMLQRIGESDRGAGGMSPTLTQLDQLRQQIGRDLGASSDAGERRMGTILRGKIDDFIANAGPEAITGGDPAHASAMIDTARDLNTRVAKLRSLDNLDDTASRRAARTGSGGNVENALRQNVDRFIGDTGNLTPAEEAQARATVMGSPGGNALRQIGKLSPFGNGLGLAIHAVGGVTSHGASLPLAVAGFAAKKASEAITSGNVQALRELIAQGGDTAAEVARQVSAQPAASDLRRQLANDLAVQAGVQGAAERDFAPAR